MTNSKSSQLDGKSTWHWLALLLLILFTALLRFYDLDRMGLWRDEAWSWYQSSGTLMDVINRTAADNYPPLHNFILNLTMRLFGDSETALRAPSALLGTLAVWLTYRTGTVLWDRQTGVVAGLLLMLSGFHVWYSQEARMYGLLSCTAVFYLLTTIHTIDKPSRRWLAANGLAGILLLYSHVYGSFIFVGINMFVLISLVQRRTWIHMNWKEWLMPQIGAAAVFSTWGINMFMRAGVIRDEGFWIPELSAKLVLGQLKIMLGGVPAFFTFFALALIAVSSLNRVVSRHDNHNVQHRKLRYPSSLIEMDWRLGLMLTWILSSLLFGIAVSIVLDQNIVWYRYGAGSFPGLLLLAAVGIRKLKFSKSLYFFALSLAILTSLPALDSALRLPERSAARGLLSAVQTQLSSGDVIFVNFDSLRIQLAEYYLRDSEFRKHTQLDTDSFRHETSKLQQFWLLTTDTAKNKRELLDQATQSHELVSSLQDKEFQANLFQKPGKLLNSQQ